MIDPTTNLGKLRLKVGDFQDLPILPDAVYTQTLTDNQDNVNRSAQTIAGYIAAVLSQRTREKLSFIEVFGSDVYDNYMKFIKEILINPNMSSVAPVPYCGGMNTKNAITQFQEDWPKAYTPLTETETLHLIANLDTGALDANRFI